MKYAFFLLFLVSCTASLNHQGPSDTENGYIRKTQTPVGTQLQKCGVVLERGALGAWDAGMIESPAVWYDSYRKKYGMVYTGYTWINPPIEGYKSVANPQIGLAWSDDLLHWEKDAHAPILSPTGIAGTSDSHGTTGPFMWFENDTYYLFYFGTTDTGYEKGLKTLNLAISKDLRTWKRYEKNPIIKPEGDGWRSIAIWHPNVVKHQDTYYLFFNVSGILNEKHEEWIGYATSKNLMDWQVDDDNSPLLVGSGEAGAWDSSMRAGDPSVYRIGNIWYMAYYSWDRKNSQDGLAWTTAEKFPLGWKPYEKNPVLKLGAPDEFDGLHAGKPFIFRTNNRHYHYYTAVDTTENREIALAVWPPNICQ